MCKKMILANINYIALLFIFRAIFVALIIGLPLSLLEILNIEIFPEIYKITGNILWYSLVAFSIYRIYTKKDLLPKDYKKTKRISRGLTVAVISYILTILFFILPPLIKPGSKIAFFYVVSITPIVIAYFAAASMVFRGVREHTQENT